MVLLSGFVFCLFERGVQCLLIANGSLVVRAELLLQQIAAGCDLIADHVHLLADFRQFRILRTISDTQLRSRDGQLIEFLLQVRRLLVSKSLGNLRNPALQHLLVQGLLQNAIHLGACRLVVQLREFFY